MNIMQYYAWILDPKQQICAIIYVRGVGKGTVMRASEWSRQWRFHASILSIGLIPFFSGCADYKVKNPIKSLNVESIVDRGPSLGKYMTKYQVLKKWGCPDEVKLVGNTPIWGAPIERWTYYAWLPDFPINYRNVAKEYRLYFQGEVLTDWEDTDKKKPEIKTPADLSAIET